MIDREPVDFKSFKATTLSDTTSFSGENWSFNICSGIEDVNQRSSTLYDKYNVNIDKYLLSVSQIPM